MVALAIGALLLGPRFTAAFPLSPDGQTYTVFDDKAKQLDLINTSTGEVRCKLSGLSVYPGVRFSDDGQFLAASNEWGEFRLWNLTTGRTIVNLTDADRQRGSSMPAAFSADGSMVAVCNLMLEPRKKGVDNPGIISVWSTRSGKLAYTLRASRWEWFNTLSFARQDSMVVGVGWKVYAFTLKTGVESVLFELEMPRRAEFGFNGRWAHYGSDEWIDVWDIDHWKSILHIPANSDKKPFAQLFEQVTPDGRFMMVTRSHEYALTRARLNNEFYAESELRELASGKVRWTIPDSEETAISCFSPDGKTLLLLNGDVRDTLTGKVLRKIDWRDRVILGENGAVIIAHPPLIQVSGI